ncbi:DUF885 domain-containing protein [Bowmanella dokdonensis]|uniref:DUF885 domain-containing protein n=1 Tax=Bowmanella dokdonensis TaxID=751969 RepID=A0A939DPP6_9ALTE|nr:DUF885 domain-containing protein [Bowmanella dokdonensis]MBN7826505.1 DUF885 domain-containing protein [Bowmanella dokdonensis]
MKALFSLLVCLSLVACGGSGGNDTANPPTTPTPGPQLPQIEDVADYQLPVTEELVLQIRGQLQGLSLDNFFAQSYALLEARNPEVALSEGKADQLLSLSLTNISDDKLLQDRAIQALMLELLQEYPLAELSDEQRLSKQVYQHYLQQQLDWADYYLYSYPATYGNFGWPGQTEFLFTDLLPVTDLAQAEQYVQLAGQIGRRLRQVESLLESRREAGIIEPRTTLSFSLDQVQTRADQAAEATPYYSVFNAKLGAISNIPGSDKQSLRDRLKATWQQIIQPAYASLASLMSQLLSQAPANVGFGQYEGGDEFYAFTLSHYTDSQMSAAQIHQLGLQELARIHDELRTLFDELGYPQNESLQQLLQRVASDGGTVAGNQAVGMFEGIIDAAYAELPRYFNALPQQEVIVIGGPTGGYYVSGSDDGTRPGAFYAQTTGNLPYYTMPTLAYHEAVPGHHLQIALAQELDLPDFRRRTNFTSFVEGWGLYAERLAKDVGWYENDIYGDIGRLQFEAMRAARLVLDTGIHAMGWTYQQAEQFSLENVGDRGTIARYSVYPGQATAYMTGLLEFLRLRQMAQAALGDTFDLKAFHQVLIGQGSMPMSMLAPRVEDFIQSHAEESPAD